MLFEDYPKRWRDEGEAPTTETSYDRGHADGFAAGLRFVQAEVDGVVTDALARCAAQSGTGPVLVPGTPATPEAAYAALVRAGIPMLGLDELVPAPEKPAPEPVVVQVSWDQLWDVVDETGWWASACLASEYTDTVSMDLGNGVVLYYDEDEDGGPTWLWEDQQPAPEKPEPVTVVELRWAEYFDMLVGLGFSRYCPPCRQCHLTEDGFAWWDFNNEVHAIQVGDTVFTAVL